MKWQASMNLQVNLYRNNFDLSNMKTALFPNLRFLLKNKFKEMAIESENSMDWTNLLYIRRKQLQSNRRSFGAWLLYGHALKECGFYGRARQAYLQANKLSPGNWEIKLQLGHFEKISGNFSQSIVYYKESFALNNKNNYVADQIRSLEKFIAAYDNIGVFPSKDLIDCDLYLSCVSKPFSEVDANDLNARIGKADYSYAFAMKGFEKALDRLGIDYRVLDDVTKFPDVEKISTARKVIHLGFYPPERITLLKGAYNIICFAWEFERLRLPEENPSYNAFSDQLTMLSLADEIWIPSRFGADSVKKVVGAKVSYVPSPAFSNYSGKEKAKRLSFFDNKKHVECLAHTRWNPFFLLPRIQGLVDAQSTEESTSMSDFFLEKKRLGENPEIYFCLFNVYDYRKQIKPLIYAFDAFSRRKKNAYLFLKIADPLKHSGHPNRSILHSQIECPSDLVAPVISRHILVSWETLTREQLNSMYSISKFYVCPSLAEGQNLPLIEAMEHKCVPVSVDKTAMSDYITDENSIIIKTYQDKAGIEFSNRYKMYGIDIDLVDQKDMYSALERASELSDDEYRIKSEKSFDTVQSIFGDNALASRIKSVYLENS